MSSSKKKWLFFPLALANYFCALYPQKEEKTFLTSLDHSPTLINSSTPIPFSESQKIFDTKKQKVEIPENLILTSRVIRPFSEIRTGPGIQFEVIRTIPKEEELVILEEHSPWLKVIVLSKHEKGWLHYKTLSKLELNRSKITLSIDHFPVIYAAKDVRQGITFKNEKPISIQLNKGTGFYQLYKKQRRVLVWSPERNGVIWLANADVF